MGKYMAKKRATSIQILNSDLPEVSLSDPNIVEMIFNNDFIKYISPTIDPLIDDAYDNMGVRRLGHISFTDEEQLMAERAYQLQKNIQLTKDGLKYAYLECLKSNGFDIAKCNIAKKIVKSKIIPHKSNSRFSEPSIQFELDRGADLLIRGMIPNTIIAQREDHTIYDRELTPEEYEDRIAKAKKEFNDNLGFKEDLYSNIINRICMNNGTKEYNIYGDINIECYTTARKLYENEFNRIVNEPNIKVLKEDLTTYLISEADITDSDPIVVAKKINKRIADNGFYKRVEDVIKLKCEKRHPDMDYCEKRIISKLKNRRSRQQMLHFTPNDVKISTFVNWNINDLINKIENNLDISIADVEHTDEFTDDDIVNLEEICKKNGDPDICNEIKWHVNEDQYLGIGKDCFNGECTKYTYEKCYPITENEGFIKDKVEICPNVWVDMDNKEIKNEIILQNKYGIVFPTVSCIHTAIDVLTPEEFENFDKESEKKILERAKSTENHPIEFEKVYPKQHFWSLNSMIEGWLDIGLTNMFESTYEGYTPEERTFGFNSLMESQLMASLMAASKEGAQTIVKSSLKRSMDTNPTWTRSHLPILFGKFNLDIHPKNIEEENFCKDVCKILGIDVDTFYHIGDEEDDDIDFIDVEDELGERHN